MIQKKQGKVNERGNCDVILTRNRERVSIDCNKIDINLALTVHSRYNVNSSKENQALRSSIWFSGAFNEQTVCEADERVRSTGLRVWRKESEGNARAKQTRECEARVCEFWRRECEARVCEFWRGRSARAKETRERSTGE